MSYYSGFAVAALLACILAQDPKGAAPAAREAAPKAPVKAEAAAAPGPRAADEEAIGKLVDAFVQAFNAGDAAALSALFTEGARVVEDDEEPIVGKANIEARFKAAFEASPGLRIDLAPDGIAFLNDDTAVEEGTAVITRGGEGEESQTTRYTVVYVKQDGKWLQASINDQTVETVVPARQHLAALEWMIGEWVDESDEAEVHTVCDWDENGVFLDRSFEVNIEGRPALSGTQRIGWDPVREQFRSWVFDSQGGFVQGEWTQIGENAWRIHNTGVTADGKSASSINTVVYVNDHTIHWTTGNRVVGDEAIPEEVEVVMVRRAPLPGGEEPKPEGAAPAGP